MKDLFRETTFGRLVRLASGNRLFTYDEEVYPSTLEQYLPNNSEKSSTSATLDVDGNQIQQKDDEAEEKGTDHLLVDFAPNDPQNPRNWSTPKKLFVTFQICLLTTSVYIGSAIYTAGLQSIVVDFDISPVKALLGLTLFVIGYALGPMVWVCDFSVPVWQISLYLIITSDRSFCLAGTDVRNTLYRP